MSGWESGSVLKAGHAAHWGVSMAPVHGMAAQAGWPRSITFLMFAYVLASQTLCDIPFWSSVAFGLALLLSLILAAQFILGTSDFRLGGWAIIPGAFIGYCWIASLYDVELGGSVLLRAVTSSFVGGLAVAVALRAGAPFRWLVYALIAATVCNMVAGFYGVGVDVEGSPEDPEVRYRGLTGNANEFAVQLVLGACLPWISPAKSGLFGCGFSFVTMIYAITKTGSRTTLVMLPIFLLLVLVGILPHLRRNRMLVGLGFLSLVLATIVMTPVLLKYSQSITTVRRVVEPDGHSLSDRAAMSRKAFELWQDAPFFGNGFDAFRRIAGFGTYAHNDAVELLCDLGILGTLGFYAMHLFIFLRSCRLPSAFRYSCRLIVIGLLALDVSCVNYYMKTPVMALMVLMSVTSEWNCLGLNRKRIVGAEGFSPACSH